MTTPLLAGPDVQVRLTKFVGRWSGYAGSEVAEAQTFLNELFECYGADRKESGARFEDFKESAGFMDLHMPGVVIVEMKAPSKDVTRAREQVKRYWEESADEDLDIPAAQWVVLCNFREFEVWEPGRFPKSPRVRFRLDELPARYEALLFLSGKNQTPAFAIATKELTVAAAATVAELYQSLLDRGAGAADELQRFIMQSVWVLFAEDLGLLDGHPLQRTVKRLKADPTRSSTADLSLLFRVMNQKTNVNRKDLLAGTRYVNGQLFEAAGDVGLEPEEVDLMVAAAEYDWSKVDPTIFGSLMENVLGSERRTELGAYYTHESDIMKIVGPTIVRPWQDRIAAAITPQQAVDLLRELCRFVVLDPACGCGNFLYVAYRELRALEYQLKQRIIDLAAATGLPHPADPDLLYYPLTNLRGLEIEPISVLISRVTLWMGHRQMIDRYGPAENPLPLVSLAGIQRIDAVFDPWPVTDCIIGNPPFTGDRKIRSRYGGEYVERLKKKFGVGVVDYCAYWFRIAHKHLVAGQRAGLVSTNTLRENKHREASLAYIVNDKGVITDAVSSQPWPGDAQVHVSMTNWIKAPEHPMELTRTLDGREVVGITAQLRQGAVTPDPVVLLANRARCFIGCQPSGRGFLLTDTQAAHLQAAGEGPVVKRYLVTDDITTGIGEPGRWIIDFGMMKLEEAMRTPKALAMVRYNVREAREEAEVKRRATGDRRQSAKYWWRFAEARPGMRKALDGLSRYIVCTLTGKRFFTAWADPAWCPSNLVGVIALDDDYSMGVLASSTHRAWAWGWSSTFETRLRYTPSTTFAKFPWPPAPTAAQRLDIATATAELMSLRDSLSRADGIGLTTLYNRLDDGAYDLLRKRHQVLDRAVVAAYGWPSADAQNPDEIVRRLRELNERIASGAVHYNPFGTP